MILCSDPFFNNIIYSPIYMDSVKLYGVFNDEIIQFWLYPTTDRSNKLQIHF